MRFSHYRILPATLILTAVFCAVKYALHSLGMEPIVLDRLHTSAISGAIFVIGFLLSATIRDYKEAEGIPAEMAAALETMHEDAISIKQNYDFNLEAYQNQLVKVAKALTSDLRNSKSHVARSQLHELSRLHADMENAGVPANFIVKLKQQQASLVRHLFRVNYIQRITFIPSASVLAWAIISIGIALLLLTEMGELAGSLMVSGAIVFILIYVSLLIQVIKTPFHRAGTTKDDVSLFLIERTALYMQKKSN